MQDDRIMTQKGRPDGRPFRESVVASLPVGGVPDGVFDVAKRLAGFALRLVHLPFGLQTLVVHHLAGGVLHGAFGLIRGAFDMFFVHDSLL
jgi:hypothetical protein